MACFKLRGHGSVIGLQLRNHKLSLLQAPTVSPESQWGYTTRSTWRPGSNIQGITRLLSAELTRNSCPPRPESGQEQT